MSGANPRPGVSKTPIPAADPRAGRNAGPSVLQAESASLENAGHIWQCTQPFDSSDGGLGLGRQHCRPRPADIMCGFRPSHVSPVRLPLFLKAPSTSLSALLFKLSLNLKISLNEHITRQSRGLAVPRFDVFVADEIGCALYITERPASGDRGRDVTATVSFRRVAGRCWMIGSG